MKTKLRYLKFTWIVIILFLIIGGLSYHSKLFSQEESKTFTKSIDANPDVSFNINNRFGDIEIVGWEQNKVSIEAKIKASGDEAKEFIENVLINIHESKSKIMVETIYPERKTRRNLSFNVDYIIKIPLNAQIKIDNQFGDVQLKELKGNLEVDLSHGSINISKCIGKNDIKNKFGSIRINEIGGDSKIENSNGSIEISNVNGNVEVQNSFGDCRATNIKGSLNLNNRNGGIIIKDVIGRADVNNQFGNIKADNIGGVIEFSVRNSDIDVKNIEGGRISNAFGTIRVENAKGKTGLTINNTNGKVYIKKCNSNVILRNFFDYIELIDIDGRVDIYSNNSSVYLDKISGDIKLENSFGSIEINGSGGDVNVRNQNGDINLQSISSLGKTYDLETSFASIRVNFPAEISAEVTANTSFGSIKSEFPFIQIEKTSSSVQAFGKTGDGSTSIRLVTRNASIYINKK